MVSSQSVKADKSYHGHASSSIPSCSYTVSICPRFFCDLWLFLSLLWCEPSTKYSSTYAGFSAECLPPCISMHFTHKHTDILSEPSCSFNFLHYLTFAHSVAFFFFFFFQSSTWGWVYQPQPTGLLAGTYISLFHLPLVDRRAKRVSCPWDHCLIKNIACHN